MFDVSITWVLVQAKTTQFSEESTFERKRIISQKILTQKFLDGIHQEIEEF